MAATPYGVSKLVGDLYVQDYAYTFGLNTTVFRMSCIYGTRQNGNVDQGWVSWMVRAATSGQDLTIYGDGLQVRDLLHVDDLVQAILTVLTTDVARGMALNMGGGPDFSVSVWAEFGSILEGLLGTPVPVQVRRLAPRRSAGLHHRHPQGLRGTFVEADPDPGRRDRRSTGLGAGGLASHRRPDGGI